MEVGKVRVEPKTIVGIAAVTPNHCTTSRMVIS